MNALLNSSFLTRLQTLGLRFAAAAVLSTTAFLAACGSGSTVDPLVPTRFVSFGDAYSDLGQTGSRYTVNDGSTNIWVEQLAASYGRNITATVAGGLGFAAGGARIQGANSIESQVTAFLAANTIGASDVTVIDAGIAEILALAQANPTDAALEAAADLAGKALAVQVKRLTAAGGKHVVIANAPDVGKSPYATSIARNAGLSRAVRKFNDGLKSALADVTNNVLLIDNEAYINIIHTTPTTLGTGGNVTQPACATPTAAIALNCTTATLAITASVPVTTANYNLFLYADDRHLTPAAHRLMGSNAYSKVRERW